MKDIDRHIFLRRFPLAIPHFVVISVIRNARSKSTERLQWDDAESNIWTVIQGRLDFLSKSL